MLITIIIYEKIISCDITKSNWVMSSLFKDGSITIDSKMSKHRLSSQIGDALKPCTIIKYLKTNPLTSANMLGEDVMGITGIPYKACINNCDGDTPSLLCIKVVPFRLFDLTQDQLVPLGGKRKAAELFKKATTINEDGRYTRPLTGEEHKLLDTLKKQLMSTKNLPPNIEATILNVLSNVSDKKTICPHTLKLYVDFTCEATQIIDKKTLDKFNTETDVIHVNTPFVRVMVAEWAKYGDLFEFLNKIITPMVSRCTRFPRMSLEEKKDVFLITIAFQLVYSLYIVQNIMPGFCHNDLHFGNILVSEGPTEGFSEYILDKRSFFLPNLGFSVKLWDFDRVSIFTPKVPGNISLKNKHISDNIDNKFSTGIIKYNVDAIIGIYNHTADHRDLRRIKNKDKLLLKIISLHNEVLEMYKCDKGSISGRNYVCKNLKNVPVISNEKLLRKLCKFYEALKYAPTIDDHIVGNGWRLGSGGFSDVHMFLYELKKFSQDCINTSNLIKSVIIPVSHPLMNQNGIYIGKKMPKTSTPIELLRKSQFYILRRSGLYRSEPHIKSSTALYSLNPTIKRETNMILNYSIDTNGAYDASAKTLQSDIVSILRDTAVIETNSYCIIT